MKAALFEAAKKIAYPALDGYWLAKRTFWRACPICGSKDPFVRVHGYGRTFLRCPDCSHLWAHDYSQARAGFGMGMNGWGGGEPDTGGDTEEFLARFCVERFGSRSILLFGTGPTRAYRILRNEGFDVYGCDVSEDVIAYRQSEFGADRFFHAKHAKSGQYDVVIATEVIEHFFNPMASFREIKRLIAPGGIFCGSTGFSRNGEVDDDSGFGYMRHRGHVIYWSKPSLRKAFEQLVWSMCAFEMSSEVPTGHLFFGTANRDVTTRLDDLARTHQKFNTSRAIT